MLNIKMLAVVAAILTLAGCTSIPDHSARVGKLWRRWG